MSFLYYWVHSGLSKVDDDITIHSHLGPLGPLPGLKIKTNPYFRQLKQLARHRGVLFCIFHLETGGTIDMLAIKGFISHKIFYDIIVLHEKSKILFYSFYSDAKSIG